MSNYTAINIGTAAMWGESDSNPGKRFIEGELGAAHSGISINSTPPGGESPFWHAHERLEEIYIILDGTGEFAVDDDVFPIGPGSAIRVAPGAMHALRCLPDSESPLKWICVRGADAALADVGKDATKDLERPFPWQA